MSILGKQLHIEAGGTQIGQAQICLTKLAIAKCYCVKHICLDIYQHCDIFPLRLCNNKNVVILCALPHIPVVILKGISVLRFKWQKKKKQNHKGTSHCGLHFTTAITPHTTEFCHIQWIKYGIKVIRTLIHRCHIRATVLLSINTFVLFLNNRVRDRLKLYLLKGVVSLVVHIFWVLCSASNQDDALSSSSLDSLSVHVPSNKIICDCHLALNTPSHGVLQRKHLLGAGKG